MYESRYPSASSRATYDPVDKLVFRERIAAAIRRERLAYGMSTTELARRCGAARAVISRFEHGHHIPSAFWMERIATALRIDVGRLFT